MLRKAKASRLLLSGSSVVRMETYIMDRLLWHQYTSLLPRDSYVYTLTWSGFQDSMVLLAIADTDRYQIQWCYIYAVTVWQYDLFFRFGASLRECTNSSASTLSKACLVLWVFIFFLQCFSTFSFSLTHIPSSPRRHPSNPHFTYRKISYSCLFITFLCFKIIELIGIHFFSDCTIPVLSCALL